VTTLGLAVKEMETTSNVYPPVSVVLGPPGLVTTTSTVPAVWTGVIAVIDVLVVPVTFVATPSSVSVAPSLNPVPVTRISDAKFVGPLFGDTAVTVSAAEGAVTGGAGVGPEGDLSHPIVAAATARKPTKIGRAKE
jgi:hypothetical protein